MSEHETTTAEAVKKEGSDARQEMTDAVLMLCRG